MYGLPSGEGAYDPSICSNLSTIHRKYVSRVMPDETRAKGEKGNKAENLRRVQTVRGEANQADSTRSHDGTVRR